MLLNTRTYATNRVTPDAVVYAGPANTLSVKDTFQQSRVYPKPIKDFSGVAKPVAKRTKTVTLTGAASASGDAIITLGGSLPVGMAAADIEGLLADMAAYCASDEAKALFKSLAV